MSCNRCANQATAAMTAAGTPASQAQATWAMVHQHLPRCRSCGRFLSPVASRCRNPRCGARGERQGKPRRWPPARVAFTVDRSKIGQAVAGGDTPEQGEHREALAGVDVAVARPEPAGDSAPLPSRCPACQAFVSADEGNCNNPLCPDKRARPGVPGPENGWEWARPAMASLPGDNLRRRLGIPLDATVSVFDSPGGRGLNWHDPERRGLFGGDQEEFLDLADTRRVDLLLADPARSGFVKIDDQAWDEAHPFIVNPLIKAPGVNPDEVEATEALLEPSTKPEGVRPFTFRHPGSWADWDWRAVSSKRNKARDFLRMFPENRLDVPLDFTRGEDDYHVGVKTPRQYAADQLSLWGIAGRGHHGEAKRLAERCGLLLVGDDTCPLQPPEPGVGNPHYLFDYRVDGSPIVAFALDLNKHHLYAWPGDGRDHKRGWDEMANIIGRDECLHNRQNWVVVRMGWDSAGTKRHDSVNLNFGWRGQTAEAQPIAATVAEALLRAGHDPDAPLSYAVYQDGRRQQVQTTVRQAAAGHAARPAPAAQHVNEVGQQILGQVVEPYARWRSRGAVNSTPQARRAANELSRAAREMRLLIVHTSLPADSPLEGRVKAFIERRREWGNDFTGMMAEFSLIKQEVHNQFRRDRDRLNRMYGAGFVERFAG